LIVSILFFISCFDLGLEPASVEEYAFQNGEEALAQGVVEAITTDPWKAAPGLLAPFPGSKRPELAKIGEGWLYLAGHKDLFKHLRSLTDGDVKDEESGEQKTGYYTAGEEPSDVWPRS
jgi:hypothetical protein